MEESDNTDISGISDTTNTEQKNEEKKDESNTKNKETVVTESDDSQKEETKVEDNTESDTDEEKTEEEKTEVETSGFAAIEEVQPVSIIINQYVDSVDDANLLTDEDAVRFVPVDGVNSSGMAVGGRTPLMFQLEVQDGWRLGAVTGKISKPTEANPDAVEDKNPTLSVDTYTLTTNGTMGSGTDLKYIYTGEITINVVVTRTKATLTSVDAGKIYREAVNDETEEKAIENGASEANIPFALFTKEVRVAVKADPIDTVKVQIGSGEETKCVRTEDTLTVGSGEAAETYTWYTFDPKAVEGYADIANNDTGEFKITKEAGSYPALTFDEIVNANADLKAIDAAELTRLTTENSTVKYYNFGGVNTPPTIAGLNKSNYDTVTEDEVVKTRVIAVEVDPGAAATSKVTVAGLKADLIKKDDAAKKVLASLEPVQASYETGAVGSKVTHTYYTVDLSKIPEDLFPTEGLTLVFEAVTTYKNSAEKFGVRDIEFTGDTANVEIKTAGTAFSATADYDANTAKTVTGPFSMDEDNLHFAIKPKTGYTITKGTDYKPTASGGTFEKTVVTVTSEKRYKLTLAADGTTEAYVNAVQEPVELEVTETSAGDDIWKATLALTGPDDAEWKDITGITADDYDENGSSGTAPWNLVNVKISVKTEAEDNQSGTFEVVSDELKYEIETGNGVEATEVDDVYSISEEAKFVVVTVTSPTAKPVVKYDATKDGNLATGGTPVLDKDMVQTDDTYKFTIPVKAFSDYNAAGGTIDSVISITRGEKSFSVTGAGSNDATTYVGNIKIKDGNTSNGGYGGDNGLAYSGASSYLSHPQGDTVPVVLYAAAGTEFATVKVVTGTGDSAKTEEITLGEDKRKVELNLAMTDTVAVKVTTKDIYNVVVKYNTSTTVTAGDDGVYEIPAGSENIKVTLNSGSTSKNIAYAKLYDGSEPAASKVTGAGSDTVTINKISDKDTGVLSLELGVKSGNKLVVAMTVQIRQAKLAEKMAVINEWDNSQVTSLSLTPDSKTENYKVTAEEGSIKFSAADIIMELAADENSEGIPMSSIGGGVYRVTDKGKNVQIDYNPVDGTLKVTALPSVNGGYTGVLRFYNKTRRSTAKQKNETDKICAIPGGTVAISTTAPVVAGASLEVTQLPGTNTKIRMQAATDVKLPTSTSTTKKNNIFYRVTLAKDDKIDTAASGKAVTYVPVFAANGSKTNGLIEIEVRDPNAKVSGKTKEHDPADFHPTVELVQTTEGNSTTPADRATENDAKTQDSNKKLAVSTAKWTGTVSTRKAQYEYDLKLSPEKATVYLGQTSKVMTTAQFSNDTGFAEITNVQFVKVKTNEETNSNTYCGLTAVKNAATGEVSIRTSDADTAYSNYKNHPEYFKDLGLKITAKTAENAQESETAMAASKVLSLNVVAGVYDVSFENGLEQSIYKQPGKKATLKVKAVLNSGIKEHAPKKKKFVYALGDRGGKLPGEDGYVGLSSQVAANVSVNAKNGTVTVNKNFVVDTKDVNNNKFSVVARETNTNQPGHVVITISEQAQSLGRVVIVDNTGKVVAEDGGVLKADAFYGRTLYVKALNGNVGVKKSYDLSTDFMDGVKYTSGAKNSLAVNSVNGSLSLLKTQAKPVKLTVAAADGSKSKQTIEVTIQGFSAIGLRISSGSVNNVNKYENPSVTYDGAFNEQFKLTPMVKVNGAWDTLDSINSKYFKNLSIKIKKAKKISVPKNEPYWKIVKTDSVTTVTITDKTNKSATMTYTIAQDPQAAIKAPKIKALTKLTQPLVESARNAATQADGIIPVRFQIQGKDNYARKYMMITPDYTKTKLLNKQAGTEEWGRANSIFLAGNSFEAVKIDGNNCFEIPLNMWQKTTNEVVPGNYTLIATVGEYKDGKFYPATKGKAIKIKIPGKAPKNLTLKLNGNFTVDDSGSAVDIASGVSSAWSWRLADTRPTMANGNPEDNYALNRIDPDTGKPNAFRDYFEVKASKRKLEWNDTKKKYEETGAVTAWTLGLKKGLTAAQIEELKSGNSKDCVGYVTVVSGSQTMDMQINVTVAATQMTAVANDSYVDAAATVKFYAGAKSTTPIELAGVWIDQSASEGSPSFVTAGNHLDTDKKGVKVKLGTAVAGKSYKVTFKVLAKDSAYANLKGKSTVTDQDLQDYGRTVTATFKVCDPAKTKNVVTIKATDESTGLVFTAYNKDTYDQTKNTYKLGIKAVSAIDGAEVSKITVDEKLGKKAFDGAGIVNVTEKNGAFTLTLDRDQFIAKDKESKTFNRAKTVDVPVTLTFKNAGLQPLQTTAKVKLPDPLSVTDAVSAAKEAAAAVQAMTPYDDVKVTSADAIKKNLEDRMYDILIHALPLDTEGVVAIPTTLKDVTKGTGENAKTVWGADLTIREKKGDKTAKYETSFEFEKVNNNLVTKDTLAELIDGLTFTETTVAAIKDNDHKLDNDYTADKLLRDIKAMLAAAPNNLKKLPANLEIIVKSFTVKKATTKAPGSMTAVVYVRDSATKRVSSDVTITTTITKLGHLGENGTDVATALADTTKLNCQDVILEALKDADNLYVVEAALKEKIRAVAENALKNPNISVEFAQLTMDGAKFENQNAAGATYPDGEKIDVGFKLPTKAADGYVCFKLLLKQDGMKDYEIDMTDVDTTQDNGGISVSNTKTVEGNPTYPFQTVVEANTALTGTLDADHFFTSSDGGSPATYTMTKSIDKNTVNDVKDEVKKLVEKEFAGKFLKAEVKDVVFRDAGDSETITENIAVGAAALVKGTIVIKSKIGRETAAEIKFKATVPEKTTNGTPTAIKIGLERKDGTKAITTDTVTQGAAAAAASVTIANIGEVQSVVTIKPELEGHWLTGNATWKYTFYSDSGYTTEWTAKNNGITPNKTAGTVTVNPTEVLTNRDQTGNAKIYAKIQAKIAGDADFTDTDGPRCKKIAISFTFTTPTTAAAEIANLTLTGVVVKYQSNAAGNAWEVTADDQTALATAVQKKLRDVTGYEDFTVVCSADIPIAFTGTYGTDDAPTAIKVKFKANRENGAARDAVETTNTVDFSGSDVVKPTTKQEAADDIADAVENLVGSLEEHTAAASTLGTADAVKTYISGVSGVATALNGAEITVATPTTNSTVVTATFTVKPTNGVKSKPGSIQITCDS